MNLKALRGRLLAELIPIGGYTRASGIHIPSTVKGIPQRAKVIAVGDNSTDTKGKVLYPPAVVGDTIHFKKYTPMFQSDAKHGMINIWWGDILMVEGGRE